MLPPCLLSRRELTRRRHCSCCVAEKYANLYTEVCQGWMPLMLCTPPHVQPDTHAMEKRPMCS